MRPEDAVGGTVIVAGLAVCVWAKLAEQAQARAAVADGRAVGVDSDGAASEQPQTITAAPETLVGSPPESPPETQPTRAEAAGGRYGVGGARSTYLELEEAN